MVTGDWAKKYLLIFDETEFDLTGNSFARREFYEMEGIWDSVVMSFRKAASVKSHEPNSMVEQRKQAWQFAKNGYEYFMMERYREALEQFEKGKMVNQEFPWNFFGAGLTIMQMIDNGMFFVDQVAVAIAKAEKDVQMCLLIKPNEQRYLYALQAIKDFKQRHNIN